MYQTVIDKYYNYIRDNYKNPTFLYISENLFYELVKEIIFAELDRKIYCASSMRVYFEPLGCSFMGLKVVYVLEKDFCEVG